MVIVSHLLNDDSHLRSHCTIVGLSTAHDASPCPHRAATQAMPTSHQRITPQSEPSEQQRLCEALIASRRSMPSPTSRAISALTAFPSTREALCSAGESRSASRLTAQDAPIRLAAVLMQRLCEERLASSRFLRQVHRMRGPSGLRRVLALLQELLKVFPFDPPLSADLISR
jgi:hypothetical protein